MTLRELKVEVIDLVHQWIEVLVAPSTWLDIPIGWVIAGVTSYSIIVYALIIAIWFVATETYARVSLLRNCGASWLVVLIHNFFVYLLIHLGVLVAATVIGTFAIFSMLAAVIASDGAGIIIISVAVGFGFGVLSTLWVHRKIDILIQPFDHIE